MPDSFMHIIVKPKSSRNEAIRAAEGVIVRVTAPPVEGAANTAVIKTLAEALSIPKSRLSIVAGTTAKLKRVAVSGFSQAELDERIAALTLAI